MGACDSSKEDQRKRSRSRGNQGPKSNDNQNNRPKLRQANESASFMEEEESYTNKNASSRKIAEYEKILKGGKKKELQRMIDNYEYNINDYVFDKSKTLLMEACIKCPNPDVVDMIMKKEGQAVDVNAEEYHSKNSAIFFAAVDLKVEFVERLLNYGVDPMKTNKDNLRVDQFLDKEWLEKRKGEMQREMTPDEKRKYMKIMKLLNRDDED